MPDTKVSASPAAADLLRQLQARLTLGLERRSTMTVTLHAALILAVRHWPEFAAVVDILTTGRANPPRIMALTDEDMTAAVAALPPGLGNAGPSRPVPPADVAAWGPGWDPPQAPAAGQERPPQDPRAPSLHGRRSHADRTGGQE